MEFVRLRRINYARSRLQALCRKNPEGFSTVKSGVTLWSRRFYILLYRPLGASHRLLRFDLRISALPIAAAPMASPPLMSSAATHRMKLLLSPVWGVVWSLGSFAIKISAPVTSLVAAASV